MCSLRHLTQTPTSLKSIPSRLRLRTRNAIWFLGDLDFSRAWFLVALLNSPRKAQASRKSSHRKSAGVGTLINNASFPNKGLEAALLIKLRGISLALPEVVETIKWGHPTFEAGKRIFAVLDHYHGQSCIAFRTSMEEQKKLCRDERFFPAPYAASRGWVCMGAEGKLNWSEVRDLILGSYRLAAAPKRRNKTSSLQTR